MHDNITQKNHSFKNTMKFINEYSDKVKICSPIFSYDNTIALIKIAKQLNLPLRFTLLLNHGRCQIAKSIEQQKYIYSITKDIYDNIEPHCSIDKNLCDYKNKFVVKPDMSIYNCASTKQGKYLCRI